jgi:hypothetical protein
VAGLQRHAITQPRNHDIEKLNNHDIWKSRYSYIAIFQCHDVAMLRKFEDRAGQGWQSADRTTLIRVLFTGQRDPVEVCYPTRGRIRKRISGDS